MPKDQFTDLDRMRLDSIEAQVYQLEMQAMSGRCRAEIHASGLGSSAKVCVFAAGHTGTHLHAQSGRDSAAILWSS